MKSKIFTVAGLIMTAIFMMYFILAVNFTNALFPDKNSSYIALGVYVAAAALSFVIAGVLRIAEAARDGERLSRSDTFAAAGLALAAVFVPTGYDEYASSAYSAVLGQIVQPWFYTQLRTEDQLGYAVFAFSMNVGRQWGMGFLLQSSDKQPDYLWQRFQAFFPQAEAKLRAMKPEEFAQIQQAVCIGKAADTHSGHDYHGRLRRAQRIRCRFGKCLNGRPVTDNVKLPRLLVARRRRRHCRAQDIFQIFLFYFFILKFTDTDPCK